MERLSSQLERLRAVVASILSLAAELKESTIEKVLAKDDVELATDLLSGKMKRPYHLPESLVRKRGSRLPSGKAVGS